MEIENLEMERNKEVDWLELEKDTIELIIKKLTVLVDFVRFGAVCKTWRSIFLENRHRLPHHQLPSVIFSDNEDRFCSFFSLSENHIYRLKKLSNEENERCCCGSSEGSLIMVDIRLNISLLNPFSRTEMPLPSLTTLSDIIDVDETETGNINYMCRLPGGLAPLVKTTKFMREMYVHKAIIGGPYVVAILAFRSGLAFCRRDGDRWTYVDGRAYAESDRFAFEDVESYWLAFEDVVCYNGNFYVIHESGHVGLLDVSGPYPTLTIVAMIVEEDIEFCGKYLVESSGQLLVVVMRMEDMCLDYPNRIVEFEIFRVDLNKHMCFPLKALGDGMLFLGQNCSMSLSAQDFSGFEGNRIYFIDGQGWYGKELGVSELWGSYNLRVYNVDDGSIESDYKIDGWPWPIWFTPKPW